MRSFPISPRAASLIVAVLAVLAFPGSSASASPAGETFEGLPTPTPSQESEPAAPADGIPSPDDDSFGSLVWYPQYLVDDAALPQEDEEVVTPAYCELLAKNIKTTENQIEKLSLNIGPQTRMVASISAELSALRRRGAIINPVAIRMKEDQLAYHQNILNGYVVEWNYRIRELTLYRRTYARLCAGRAVSIETPEPISTTAPFESFETPAPSPTPSASYSFE